MRTARHPAAHPVALDSEEQSAHELLRHRVEQDRGNALGIGITFEEALDLGFDRGHRRPRRRWPRGRCRLAAQALVFLARALQRLAFLVGERDRALLRRLRRIGEA